MEQSRMVLEEMEALECIAFLIASARGLETEPKDYGPMRLMSAANSLGGKIMPRVSDHWKPFLDKLLMELPKFQRERQRYPERYNAFLDDCCREFTELFMSIDRDIE